MDDFEYDEGSDVDNWEAEQVFQDEQFEREDDWICNTSCCGNNCCCGC